MSDNTRTADEIHLLRGVEAIEEFANRKLQKTFREFYGKTLKQIRHQQAMTRIERGSTSPEDVAIVLRGTDE